MAIPQTILFDFDGVLCKGRFYEKTLLPDHPEIYDWIQRNIFGNKEMVRDWMRNRITSAEINELIAKNTGIEYEFLNGLYEESIRKMELEKEIKALAESLKLSGKKIGIVTDNMDVFTEITVSNHKLNELFDTIVNSADYGYLKKDENGKLFDIAIAAVGEDDFGRTLLIDDSADTIELYRGKGGKAFLYKNFEELQVEFPWVR